MHLHIARTGAKNPSLVKTSTTRLGAIGAIAADTPTTTQLATPIKRSEGFVKTVQVTASRLRGFLGVKAKSNGSNSNNNTTSTLSPVRSPSKKNSNTPERRPFVVSRSVPPSRPSGRRPASPPSRPTPAFRVSHMVPASRPARPAPTPRPSNRRSSARLPPTVPTRPSSVRPSKIPIRVGRLSPDVCKVPSTPAVCVHCRSSPSSTPAAASPITRPLSPIPAAPQAVSPEVTEAPLRVSIGVQTEAPAPAPLPAPVAPVTRTSSSAQTEASSNLSPANPDPGVAPSAAHVKTMIDIGALLKEKPRLRVTNTFKRLRAVQGTAGANEDLLAELKGRISTTTTPARTPARARPPVEASPMPSPSPAMLRPRPQPHKEEDTDQGSPIQELRTVLSQRKASLRETLVLTSDGSLNDQSPPPIPWRLRRPLAPVFVQNRLASDSRFPAASSPAPIKPFEALRRRFLVPELDENTRPSSNPWIALELESLRSQGRVGGGGTMEGAPRREVSLVALGIFQKNRKPRSKENEVVL